MPAIRPATNSQLAIIRKERQRILRLVSERILFKSSSDSGAYCVGSSGVCNSSSRLRGENSRRILPPLRSSITTSLAAEPTKWALGSNSVEVAGLTKSTITTVTLSGAPNSRASPTNSSATSSVGMREVRMRSITFSGTTPLSPSLQSSQRSPGRASWSAISISGSPETSPSTRIKTLRRG